MDKSVSISYLFQGILGKDSCNREREHDGFCCYLLCDVIVWEDFLERLLWEGYSKNGSILNVFSHFFKDIVWWAVVLAKMLCAECALWSDIHKSGRKCWCFLKIWLFLWVVFINLQKGQCSLSIQWRQWVHIGCAIAFIMGKSSLCSFFDWSC